MGEQKLEYLAQDREKNQDLKSLVDKFLDYSLSRELGSSGGYRNYEKYEREGKKMYNLLSRILENISLLINKPVNDPLSDVVEESRQTEIMLLLDKAAYSFFLGYGLLLKNRKRPDIAMLVWERILNFAKKNEDLEYSNCGTTKNVLKIRNNSNKRTIIFKKIKGDTKESGLELDTWYYYTFCNSRARKILSQKEGIKPWEQPNYFSLPKRILGDQSMLEKDAAYLIWEADSEDLLNKIIKSDEKVKKKLLSEYLKEIARLDAFGPFHLVPKQRNLISKEDFTNRIKHVINQRDVITPKIKNIIDNYNVIAENLSKSKVYGIVKDATLNNAVCKNKKVTPIDFDKLRIAPIQHDLSKLLVLSYDQRHKFLKEFIERYNLEVNFFNQNFANKVFSPPFKKEKVEPERQKIVDSNEFYFGYLNSVIDYALHFLLENKHQKRFENLDINRIQKYNALSAIGELKREYRNNYNLEEIKQLDSLSEIFKNYF